MKTTLNLIISAGLSLFACLAFALPLGAQEGMGPATKGKKAPSEPGYLDPHSVDYASVVPPVPTAGSIADMTDFETLLRVQAMRSPADEKWANTILKADAFSNADIIGDWFKADRLPATAALLKKSGGDANAVTNVAKEFYKRTRPYSLNTDIKPCVPLPGGYSYPSGFAMQVLVRAGVLAALFPDKGPELLAKARANAWARIVGGVHYPSDVVAGRLLAKLVVEDLFKDPGFMADFEKAKSEIAALSTKP
jgi:acid phosphatase (class A)